jgi:hypothetical protein
MSYTKHIYYTKCSTTSDYEFIVDSSSPTACPYHGGALTSTPIIVDTNRIYSSRITNNYIDNFQGNAYSKVFTSKLNGVKNAVLREIRIISKKYKNTTSYDIRIININNNRVIAEVNSLTNDDDNIITITDANINNLPYEDSIMEIQVNANGTNNKNKNVNISEVEFVYEKVQ